MTGSETELYDSNKEKRSLNRKSKSRQLSLKGLNQTLEPPKKALTLIIIVQTKSLIKCANVSRTEIFISHTCPDSGRSNFSPRITPPGNAEA